MTLRTYPGPHNTSVVCKRFPPRRMHNLGVHASSGVLLVASTSLLQQVQGASNRLGYIGSYSIFKLPDNAAFSRIRVALQIVVNWI